MKKDEEIVKHIAEMIGLFLMKNGGMSNGMRTFAQGSIRHNHTGSLTISVNNGNITISNLNELAHMLEFKIKLYLKEIDFTDTILIEPRHMDYGTFETTVFIKRGYTVPLYHSKKS